MTTNNADDELSENMDFLICSGAAGMEYMAIQQGNLLGECSRCRAPIIYSTQMPKKPQKLCFHCAIDMWDAEIKGHDVKDFRGR